MSVNFFFVGMRFLFVGCIFILGIFLRWGGGLNMGGGGSGREEVELNFFDFRIFLICIMDIVS